MKYPKLCCEKMDDFFRLQEQKSTTTISKSNVLVHESIVESINVEIKENVSNIGELNKLHDLLQEYESHGKELTTCVNNSKNFSNLFPYSSAQADKIEKNVLKTEGVNTKQEQDAESTKRIADLRNKVAGMASFDEILTKVKNEHQNNKYDVHKQIHKALQPTRYELARAHMKRRQRNHARIILLRFFKKCLLGYKRNSAARKIYRCFLFYIRVVKTNKKATVIQSAWRRFLARKRCAHMKEAAFLISRKMRRNLLRISAKQKLRKLIWTNAYCIKIQSIIRGIRGRRLVTKLRQDKAETKAALTIQNMYWAK